MPCFRVFGFKKPCETRSKFEECREFRFRDRIMVQIRGGLLVVAGVLGAAEARTHSKPAHVLKMKQRPRPIKDEQDTRVTTLHKNMRDLKLNKGISSDVETTYDSVSHESEAYYAYPLTLDYVSTKRSCSWASVSVRVPAGLIRGGAGKVVRNGECLGRRASSHPRDPS